MRSGIARRLTAVALALAIVGVAGAAAPGVVAARHVNLGNRFLMVAKSDAAYAGLRSDILAAGGRIVSEIARHRHLRRDRAIHSEQS